MYQKKRAQSRKMFIFRTFVSTTPTHIDVVIYAPPSFRGKNPVTITEHVNPLPVPYGRSSPLAFCEILFDFTEIFDGVSAKSLKTKETLKTSS
jgi:hypothetical protein